MVDAIMSVQVNNLTRSHIEEIDQLATVHPNSSPTSHDLNVIGTVSGYERATFQSDCLVAPPRDDTTFLFPSASTSSDPHRSPPSVSGITEVQAHEALLKLAGETYCWGKKAARDMVISAISSSSAFHYKLDTFTESRKTTWAYSPYHGDPIDGPFNGPAPPPWSVLIQPDDMFRNHEKYCEVPHTACIKPCHDCVGTGFKRCITCQGKGRTMCMMCHGSGHQAHFNSGYDHFHHHHGHHHHGHHHHGHYHNGHHHHMAHSTCVKCCGTGHTVCWACSGCCKITCNTCNGKSQLKCYIKLIVNWQTHTSDHIVESTALPNNLIRGATGKTAFEELAVRVAPIGHFPNAQINSASQSLVQQHATKYPNERILMQRHQVSIIPVAEVQSNYKGTPFNFWVYGNDNMVYAPDYPQQCCCGCIVL